MWASPTLPLIQGEKPMNRKKLTPRNTAPVKRENVATVSTSNNAIAPCLNGMPGHSGKINPFAIDSDQ